MHHPPDCTCSLHQSLDPIAHARKVRLLWAALLLIGGFAIAELVVGLQSHSLALLADSEHMVSDGLALGVALLATWIAQFPPSDQAPFGYRRVEILAALANGLGLVAIALWIGWEAIVQLQLPPNEILSLPMLITAAVGVVVNGINVVMLHQDSHHDLNLRGAFLHMVADMVGSVGVLLAAIAITAFHWLWADSVVSLLVSVLIIAGAIPLIRQSLVILLEQPPAHLELAQMRQWLETQPGIAAVNQLRAWTIAPGQEIVVAWLTIQWDDLEDSGARRDDLLHVLQTTLQKKFGIYEVMLQVTGVKPVIKLERSLLEAISSSQL